MASPPIPDNINTGQGVDGFGIGYFNRHIPLPKGGGGVPAGFVPLFDIDGSPLFDLDGRILYEAA